MRRWVVGQWLKQRNLSLKITGHPFQLSEEETTRRLGAFWRNCVRRLCFFGEDVGVDGFGQSPFYRRMNSQKCVQPKGAGAPALMEKEEDAENRFAVTILASSRPPHRDPEVLFRGQAESRPKDIAASALKNASSRFPLSAT